MVAAAIRTVFAQPDPPHVRSQLDEVARMLEGQFPIVAGMLRDACEDLLAFAGFPVSPSRSVLRYAMYRPSMAYLLAVLIAVPYHLAELREREARNVRVRYRRS